MIEKTVIVPEQPYRISALFRELQIISGDDSAKWNATGEELAEKGLMWVVVRYEVNLFRNCLPGETLTIASWASPFRHRMSQRNYIAADQDGTCVFQAAGIWAVADRKTRSLADPEKRGIVFPGEIREKVLPRPASPVKLPLVSEKPFIVTEDVLDINGHMNNTKYFDAVQDCMDINMQTLTPKRIQAVFSNEVRPGDEIMIRWGQNDTIWFFEGEKKGEGCFQVGLVYE